MSENKIVIASGNKGKIRELQALLESLSVSTVPQSQFNVESVDETGFTFIENALLKARHACEQTGLPAIADDSGLCIKALNNAPGIYSARYAGPDATDVDLVDKVLKEMHDVPDTERQCAYHAMIVYLEFPKDPDPIIAHGVWHGDIVHHAKGTQGFGYDPIFYVPEFGCTAAELDPAVKNKISHRGKALQLLMQQFKSRF